MKLKQFHERIQYYKSVQSQENEHLISKHDEYEENVENIIFSKEIEGTPDFKLYRTYLNRYCYR